MSLAKLRDKVTEISLYLVRDFKNPRVSHLFFRSLVAFTIVKMVLLLSFSRQVMAHHNITLPRSWIGKLFLGPSFLANYNVDIFFSIAIVCLVVIFLKRPNYLTTAFFFWLALNLYVVYLPFANGSDMLLVMLALWYIPVATQPVFKSEMGAILQKAVFNTGMIFCQLQVIFIYFISGADKLISKAWRSGEAFDYIAHLETMYNPLLSGVFEEPTLKLILSWSTILFELGFVILVWFERTRLPVLLTGIFFHLFIWIVMSLPDFASLMMLSYILFLKDRDLDRFQNLFRRSPL